MITGIFSGLLKPMILPRKLPFFQLTDELIFPDPSLATNEGLLAVGGDLSPERILIAYQLGIFPWFNEGDPILWWSPDPRMILRPEEFHVSRSLQRILNKRTYDVKFNTCFEEIVNSCSKVPRKEQEGTWITEGMKVAYCNLHHLGYAHSVEVFREGRLVG